MKTLMMIRRMKEVLTWVWIAVIGTAICLNVCAQTPQDWKGLEKQLNFYMANDLGRNGYYDQKPIAELMGEMADVIGPECVFAAGDVHHFEGVRSVNDPLWMTIDIKSLFGPCDSCVENLFSKYFTSFRDEQ